MYPGYEHDRRHADMMDFRFKARLYKLIAIVGGFIGGALFLPFMAAWDAGADEFQRDFSPINGVGWMLLAMFALCGIVTSIFAFLFVHSWQYRAAPSGYDYNRVW